ncbi:MAG: M14-type cytosolic carboxypeptidase [Bryobacteraceae bacterium]|nr:M14-type cytosolic carboxypeptidase [Bryobacteraceae bacterium]MDW8380206.1 M14-type cytosolic carboxypeptidase [Bryobacterales bacterium]
MPAITLETNFEGGNLGYYERVGPAHLRLGVKGEKDQDGRNRQANWYSFRVEGATPGQKILFDLVDLPGEYNYRPNRGAITQDTPPVIREDQTSWRHVTDYDYDANEPKLRVRVIPQAAVFWLAHVPPYTNRDLMALEKECQNHPAFQRQIIGKSLGHRPLLLWTIAENAGTASKPTVWLMFRQHSWEAGTSWVAEGAVRALLSEQGAELRRNTIWKIFPLCDPDGVARGGVRFNSLGYDLNRNWDVEDPQRMPEITAQRQAMRDWISQGHRIKLFLSLHNTETAEYLEGPPNPDATTRALAEKLFEKLNQTSFDPSRPLSFSEVSTALGVPGRMTVVQGLARDFGIRGFLMEQRISFHRKFGRLPLPEDRLRFGRELVEVMWQVAHAV